MLSCSCAWIKRRYLAIRKLEGVCWIKQCRGEKKKIRHCHPVTNLCNCASSWQNSEIVSRHASRRCHQRLLTGRLTRLACQYASVPVLHYLLSDHLDVFEALHAADVVHQDVGVGVADTSAA